MEIRIYEKTYILSSGFYDSAKIRRRLVSGQLINRLSLIGSQQAHDIANFE